MKRRHFLKVIAGAACWPRPATAQLSPVPVIGLLRGSSLDAIPDELRGFREGLKDTGFTERENLAIEYRSADNQIDRLPALAAELAAKRVTLIAAGDNASSVAAKAATSTIPITFVV